MIQPSAMKREARLRAPFPFYGSKLAAADLIEQLHGDANNLVIPFAGSLGELLGRSSPARVETVNDADGLVVNAWRSIKLSPDRVAELCDHPVHEVTLHAVHDLLVERAHDLTKMLRSGPHAHDVELAAWWIWGASCWLGGGWCRTEQATHGQKPAVGGAGAPRFGRGVVQSQLGKTHRKRPAIGGQGDRPHGGRGVVARGLSRQMPAVSGSYTGHPALGTGVHSGTHREALLDWFQRLADRLRFVRFLYGDWRRLVTEAVTTSHGLTAINLDPPYCHSLRHSRLYRIDDPEVSGECREWALEHGDNELLRITLCGKVDEHDETLGFGWSKHEWRKDGETIWASPHCLASAREKQPEQLQLGLGDRSKR